MKQTSQKSIFEYLDYREYLRDWYHSRKEGRSTISLRSFSKKAGFTSSNILKLVMDGDRNLTEESAGRFAIGLGLNLQETAFFVHLVHYSQATTHDKKDHHYKALVQSKKFGQLKPIEKDRYDYYSTWYHPVVRELVTAENFDGTPEWLVQHIRPEITAADARKSVELLERLGFIKKTAHNKWAQTDSLVTTGAESASHILLHYHQSLLEITRLRLGQVKQHERDVSALTLGVSKEKIPEIKKMVQAFRREILKAVSAEKNPEVVLSLTTQLLPLSELEGGAL